MFAGPGVGTDRTGQHEAVVVGRLVDRLGGDVSRVDEVLQARRDGDGDGDRVLVVRAGNSGCGLAVDVAQHRLDADIVTRHGSCRRSRT
ncbi:hypothetical protein ACWC09_18635 [Streptomyces sp. NPDC001617]